jgi:hypothetical protein
MVQTIQNNQYRETEEFQNNNYADKLKNYKDVINFVKNEIIGSK